MHSVFRRITLGVGANVYDKAAISLSQLVSVPIFATVLGLDAYGQWLLIFTIPSYLAFGDFGLGVVASNHMTAACSRSDFVKANSIFYTANAAVFVLSSIVVILSTLTLLMINVLGVFQINTSAFFCAIIYGVLLLSSGTIQAGYRASKNYAMGVLISGTTYAIETILACLLCIVFKSIEAVGLGYVIGRLLGFGAQWLVLNRKVSWLRIKYGPISFSELRSLARPGWSAMALPFSQALVLQGVTLVLGITMSATAVAIYATVRTMTRIAIQAIGLINNALMPEMTLAHASYNNRLATNIFKFTFWFSTCVALLAAAMVVSFGEYIIYIWTNGTVRAQFEFIVLMGGTIAAHGIWMSLANLVLSVNRQETFSYFYALSALLMIVCAFPLSLALGLPGAALSVLLLDLTMLIRLLRISRIVFRDYLS